MGNTAMQILDASTSDQRFKLGDKFESNGKTYRYVQFTATINNNVYCYIDLNWKTVALTTANGTKTALVGCVQYDATANEYGWVQTAGDHSGRTLVSGVEGAKFYTTSTAGSVDDNSSSTVLIHGLTALETTVAGVSSMRAVTEMYIN